MPRVACAVVCALALLSGLPVLADDGLVTPSACFVATTAVGPAAAVGGQRDIVIECIDFDVRPYMGAVEQTPHTAGQMREGASPLRLFAPVRRHVPINGEAAEPRRGSSSMKIRENSFPSRKVALQGAVRDGLFLKVSLGVDHELERGGIGRPTPSFGVQFERTFR